MLEHACFKFENYVCLFVRGVSVSIYLLQVVSLNGDWGGLVYRSGFRFREFVLMIVGITIYTVYHVLYLDMEGDVKTFVPFCSVFCLKGSFSLCRYKADWTYCMHYKYRIQQSSP